VCVRACGRVSYKAFSLPGNIAPRWHFFTHGTKKRNDMVLILKIALVVAGLIGLIITIVETTTSHE
jgi:hypothetical protein